MKDDKKLVIGYFYPKHLNLYGDDGNVQILKYRAKKRGFNTEVINVTPGAVLSENDFKKINFIFMGGGPDSGQLSIYKDLIENKKNFIKDYIKKGGVGLFICGAYQLLGNYYKTFNGEVIEGLKIVDFYTKHAGKSNKRCVGNVVCKLNDVLLRDPLFKDLNNLGSSLVGFENHGGRTFLSENVKPFAKVVVGYGNNLKDNSEGILYKNIVGSYLHGPLLSKNPHLADYFIAKSLNIKGDLLTKLDDSLIFSAHTASKNLV